MGDDDEMHIGIGDDDVDLIKPKPVASSQKVILGLPIVFQLILWSYFQLFMWSYVIAAAGFIMWFFVSHVGQ